MDRQDRHACCVAAKASAPTTISKSLLSLPEEEVARHFMNDPRFGDAMLDFNMYFMGFKADDIKTDGAINSTRSILPMRSPPLRHS